MKPSTPKGRTLAEFIAAKPRKLGDCDVCKLPQVAEINSTRKAGLTRNQRVPCKDIVAWLEAEHGVKGITDTMLQRHFTGRHHEAA